MAKPGLGEIVARAWEQELRESEDPFTAIYWSAPLFSGMGLEHSYRERLDHIPRNWYGELIPRIVTVRRNLRMLGNIRLDPRRLP